MSPFFIEATGYAATALNVAGNLMLAKLSIRGWVVRMLTNVVYIVYALQISQGLPVVANHILFLGINAYGYWRWQKEARKSAKSATYTNTEPEPPLPGWNTP